MEIIAITDHNSGAWCDGVVEAAKGTRLNVFPGSEISTNQGHLIAIFEPSLSSEAIDGLLMNAGIKQPELGSVNAVATDSMQQVSERIEKAGGLAIAAHVDGEKGFMRMVKVGATKKAVYECSSIRAFEITDPTQRDVYLAGTKPGYDRRIPCVQGSDCRVDEGGAHQLDAIGARHCYLKIDDISIDSLRQALLDPEMRVRFVDDDFPSPGRVIEGIWVSGGFLQGQTLRFNDNLNCLIGGTGVGKSLTVELIRFVLHQQTQVDKIRDEVDSLLERSLGEGGKAAVVLRRFNGRYLLERTLSTKNQQPTTVFAVDDDGSLAPLEDVDLTRFFPIKAYSQSEIIEFTRDAPVRLSLIDDLLNLTPEREAISGAKGELRTNAAQLVETSRELEDAEEALKDRATIKADVEKLKAQLNDERIAQHRFWYDERDLLEDAENLLDTLQDTASADYPSLSASFLGADGIPEVTPSRKLLQEVQDIENDVRELVSKTAKALKDGVRTAQAKLAALRKVWEVDFNKAEQVYQGLLQELDTEDIGYQALSEDLLQLKVRDQALSAKRKQVINEIKPKLRGLGEARDSLLTELQQQRTAVREKRSAKAAEVTQALEDRVRVSVKKEAESQPFQDALMRIKVGTLIRDDHIALVAVKAHPVPFVKSLLENDYQKLSDVTGIDSKEFEKLWEVVVAENRVGDLYEMQLVDVEDRIDVSLRVGDGVYKDLKQLAHGEKCTAVLSVAMAEGEMPVIADQPEDALHAQFIVDHVVETLRNRRGARQYLFATRNANILVSGDAEQVFVLGSDGERGYVESVGSVDRLSTRELILLNLEGGEEAFARRSLRYGVGAQ